MPALLDDTGLQIPTLTEIREGTNADLWANISETLDLEEESELGEIVGALSSQIRQTYELVEAGYNARDIDQAEGHALAGLCALTGTIPLAATASYVYTALNLDVGTYAAGDLIAHVLGDPSKRFANDAEIVVTVGGVQADPFKFVCLETGPVSVAASTLTVIAEAVTGWNAVTNGASTTAANGGYLGTDAETDTALRLRQQQELARGASSTVDAIRTDILDLDGVTSCTVLENVTDAVDANGLPAHSVAAVVRGGTAAEIAAAIFAAKAGGIATYGGISTTVTDDQGVDHTIQHSTATAIPLYCTVSLTAVTGEYEGDDAVIAALVAEFGSMPTGRDVKTSRGYAAILSVAGVVDVTAYLLDNVDPPVAATNITIDWDEYGNLDDGEIAVTSTLISGYP